jgi:hypothetical protein
MRIRCYRPDRRRTGPGLNSGLSCEPLAGPSPASAAAVVPGQGHRGRRRTARNTPRRRAPSSSLRHVHVRAWSIEGGKPRPPELPSELSISANAGRHFAAHTDGSICIRRDCWPPGVRRVRIGCSGTRGPVIRGRIGADRRVHWMRMLTSTPLMASATTRCDAGGPRAGRDVAVCCDGRAGSGGGRGGIGGWFRAERAGCLVNQIMFGAGNARVAAVGCHPACRARRLNGVAVLHFR